MKFTILPMYHPAAALHNPRLWADILEDWQHKAEKVPHDYIVTESRPTTMEGMEYALDVENDPDGTMGEWSIAYREAKDRLCVMPFKGTQRGLKLRGRCIEHNAKYDTRVLARNGMTPPEDTHDTMIAAYCMGLGKTAPKEGGKEKSGSDMVGGLGLKYLARRHLGINMKSWQEVKDHPEWKEEYNAMDSVATLLLWEKWQPQLPEHYWQIDMPLLKVLMAIEDRGIQVDPDFLTKYAQNLDVQLAKIDLPFRPFARAEIQSYVYGNLGIEPWKFTPMGEPSTEDEVLETIDDPAIQELLRFKGLYKERNTDAKGYMAAIDPEGRIHTELKQTSTATGRLSSANPNLQNVLHEGDMRKLFVAPEGKKLIRLDWSQLELRFLAALTQDPVMLRAFERGEDIHQATAEALNVSRYDAKTNNFLTIYGGTAWKIAAEFHISIDAAKKFQEDYFRKFPSIKKYMDEMRAIANEQRHVTNYFGRTRRIDAMYAKDWRIRQAGEREAINMPIQGGSGEVVKLAMIDLHYKHSAPILLQVHDELLFEVDELGAEEYAHWLEEYVPKITTVNGMEFPVAVTVGNSWYETMKEEGK